MTRRGNKALDHLSRYSCPPVFPQNSAKLTGSRTAEALDYKNGYLQQFNIDVEKAFGAHVFGVTYVGEYGGRPGEMTLNLDVPAPSTTKSLLQPILLYATVPGISTILYLQSQGV